MAIFNSSVGLPEGIQANPMIDLWGWRAHAEDQPKDGRSSGRVAAGLEEVAWTKNGPWEYVEIGEFDGYEWNMSRKNIYNSRSCLDLEKELTKNSRFNQQKNAEHQT